jgi:ABC-type antimicrobial peptide transport system permease subunit
MWFVIKYFIKRLPREGFKSLSIPVLALILVFLINLLFGVKFWYEEEYDYAMNTLPVRAVVSDGDGFNTDGLEIHDKIIDIMVNPDAHWSLSELVEDVQMKRTLHIVEKPEIEASEPIETSVFGFSTDIALNHLPQFLNYIQDDIYSDLNGHSEVTFFDNILELHSESLQQIGLDTTANDFDLNDFDILSWNFLWPSFISENLLDYINDGYIYLRYSEVRGPNLRTWDFHLPVFGTISESSAGQNIIITSLDFSNFIYRNIGGHVSYNWFHVVHEGQEVGIGYSTIGMEVIPQLTSENLGTIIGISHIYADETLNDNNVQIEFFERYDARVFEGNGLYAIVSEDFHDIAENGKLNTFVRSVNNAINDVEAVFTIVGTVSGLGEGIIYIPFWTATELGMESDGGTPVTESLSVTIADNWRISEFKEIANRTFSRPGTFFNPLTYAMLIYDAEFYDITETLIQTIFFIETATPFVYVISIAVGFIASFLLIRRRKSEFAVMRSIGVNRKHLFMGALFEQTMLCATGAGLGTLLFNFIWGYMFWDVPLIFTACYTMGAIITATGASGADVLKILRSREN